MQKDELVAAVLEDMSSTTQANAVVNDAELQLAVSFGLSVFFVIFSQE